MVLYHCSILLSSHTLDVMTFLSATDTNESQEFQIVSNIHSLICHYLATIEILSLVAERLKTFLVVIRNFTQG